MASTHHKVTAPDAPDCLGPDGSAQLVADVFRSLEGRWKLPILFRLYGAGVLRFSDLQRAMPGVSHKMLTQHLRELEADGLVARTDYAEQPPRVEYRLSADGEALRPVLVVMRDFGRARRTFHHAGRTLRA